MVAVCLVFGIALIVSAIAGLVRVEPGWSTIEDSTDKQITCSGDFVFQYMLGAGGKAPNVEQRQVTAVYTQAAKEAFQLFHTEKVFPDVFNIGYLNAHPNETVQVPQALYEALALFEKYGNRSIFLAPIYAEYVGLCLCSNDEYAKAYDPTKSVDQAAYFKQVLAFTGNPDAVSLMLLENNQVRLQVSESYLAFAREKGITAFVDFGWMKNAFVADFLAEKLIAAGYTKGTLSSFEGFVRNLDTTEEKYRLNIFDLVGDKVYSAATMEYSKVGALVTLRSYPMSKLAVQQYYAWADGTITSCHIDPITGLSKSALNDLLGYSRTLSCGEILLKLFPCYVKEEWNADAAKNLQNIGVETVYCESAKVYASDGSVKILNYYNDGKITYQAG